MKYFFLSLLILINSTSCLEAKPIDRSKISLVSTEWAPFMGSNLPNQGLIAKIAQRAFERVDINIGKITFRPWLRAMSESAKGKYTGLIGAYYNDERTKTYLYSDPILISYIAIMARKDSVKGEIKKFEELNPRRIGLVKGYEYPERVKLAKFTNPEYSMNDEQNLKLIERDQIQVVIIDKDHFDYHANKKIMETTRVIGTPMEHKTIHLIIPKVHENAQEIIDLFNKGLKQLKDSGEITRIYESYREILSKHKTRAASARQPSSSS